MRPRASIVIVTYGQRALTEQCLRSLHRSLGPRLGREFELVLVDNASPDDTPELLRAWSDRAVVELLPENRNFAGGCNAGARLAHGEALIFLNNDTEVTPGALEALAEQALEPGVSVAGCRLHFPDGTLQHAGVAFMRNRWLNGAAMPQHVFHHLSPELPAAQAIYECDAVTAACMAVRADTFVRVGGFDEGFRNGLEDVDLCLRIRVLGEAVVYRGDVVVVHHEGASRGRGQQLVATPERLAMMRHNDDRFCARWAAHLEHDDAHARGLWDARLSDEAPAREGREGDVGVVGQPSGIGPGAAEACAFLAALAAAGFTPTAVDHPAPGVLAERAPADAALLHDARRRRPSPAHPWLLVPAGARDALAVDAPHIVRVGRPLTATPLTGAREIWASCPAIADALVAQGLDRARIRLVAPPLPATPLGRGGAGLLAVLPAHDRERTRRTLDLLRDAATGVALTIVPTVMARGLSEAITDRLPGARLLGPIAGEERFGALAADSDLVLVDDEDPFQRRALLAALRGTPALVAGGEGPARWLLGAEAGIDEHHAVATLRAHLEGALERAEWARRAALCTRPLPLARQPVCV